MVAVSEQHINLALAVYANVYLDIIWKCQLLESWSCVIWHWPEEGESARVGGLIIQIYKFQSNFKVTGIITLQIYTEA